LIGFARRQLASTLAVLAGFRGNARAILITEPFWGIPYFLYTTYASVYMLALGCTAQQVGLIATVGQAVQMALSLGSGWITDRLGRKRTTLLFDLVSWSIPTLLWAFARDFRWFLAAAVINAIVRIVATSWSCLLIEDTPAGQRVHVFTWISVAGIVAGFISPLAGLFVKGFGLVPAMRGVYLFAFASMTFMFFFRNSLLRETAIGLAKVRESRRVAMRATLGEYARIAGHLARSPLTLAAFAISILANIAFFLKATFLPILLIRGLGFPEANIAVFPAITSAVMLAVLVLVMPSLARRGIARPLFAGAACAAAGAALLALSPSRSFPVVIVSTLLGGVGSALTLPLSDTLIANTVAEADRAKAMSIYYVLLLGLTSPFGWIGGALSEISPRLPFLVMGTALALAAGITLAIPRMERKQAGTAPADT
jgi:DHA1 family tetracycline resistance protein-like MFS transporter